MKYLLIGGQSSTNQQWLVDLTAQLKRNGDECDAHQYLAWQTQADSNENAQIAKELENAQQRYSDQKYDVIIAKSLGCLLALPISAPLKVLIGPPSKRLKEFGFDLLRELSHTKDLILVTANDEDELVDWPGLKALAKRMQTMTLQSGHKRGHTYEVSDLQGALRFVELHRNQISEAI